MLRPKGSDVTNAYFQAKPLTRLLLMKQPAGALGDPDVPAEACLLCRVPIYGSIDAGRGFYLRMDSEVKDAGMKASKVMPALYYHLDENGDHDAMLCTHVDDLLSAHKPSGAKVIEDILGSSPLERPKREAFATADGVSLSTMTSPWRLTRRRTPEESSRFQSNSRTVP